MVQGRNLLISMASLLTTKICITQTNAPQRTKYIVTAEVQGSAAAVIGVAVGGTADGV